MQNYVKCFARNRLWRTEM